MRNLQEQVKKAFCYQKLFWPFTVWINCLVISKFLQILGLQPRISKLFSITRTFFFIVGQNNFGNKIPMYDNWPDRKRSKLIAVTQECVGIPIGTIATWLVQFSSFRFPQHRCIWPNDWKMCQNKIINHLLTHSNSLSGFHEYTCCFTV